MEESGGNCRFLCSSACQWWCCIAKALLDTSTPQPWRKEGSNNDLNLASVFSKASSVLIKNKIK